MIGLHYLVQFSTAGTVNDADHCVVVQQQVHACSTVAVAGTQVERRQTSTVMVIHTRTKVQQSLPITHHIHKHSWHTGREASDLDCHGS